jgi:hypothetical protein
LISVCMYAKMICGWRHTRARFVQCDGARFDTPKSLTQSFCRPRTTRPCSLSSPGREYLPAEEPGPYVLSFAAAADVDELAEAARRLDSTEFLLRAQALARRNAYLNALIDLLADPEAGIAAHALDFLREATRQHFSGGRAGQEKWRR